MKNWNTEKLHYYSTNYEPYEAIPPKLKSKRPRVVRSYASGGELAAEITKRGGLFIGEVTDPPDNGWDRLVDGVDRTPRQMIAYQLGWMELLLGWERDEQAGKEVVTPHLVSNGISSVACTSRLPLFRLRR